MRTVLKVLILVLLVYAVPPSLQLTHYFLSDTSNLSWWQLRRDETGLAPDPGVESRAVVQVYAARAARWRGAFGVHSWMVVKPTDADRYTRLEVIGYALRWSGTTVRISSGRPDSWWYGNPPQLLSEIRGGADVDALIQRLLAAARDYPQHDQYRVWPGPNSNTFIAELARVAPELRLVMPVTAVGKDYLLEGRLLSIAPSHTGFQFSLGGMLGLMLAREEGLELTVAGLTAGIDPWPLALKLPGIGRLGFH